MNKVTLEKVFTKVKETKFGPKLSVGLKIKEATVTDVDGVEVQVNDRYLNAWLKEDAVFPHKEGDVIEIAVKQRGEWLDFSLGAFKGGTSSDGPRLAAIEARLSKLEAQMAGHHEDVETEPEW